MRDAAARGGIAVDHQQPAMRRRARRLAGVAAHMHVAGHHVLGDAGAGVAVDDDRGAACSCRRSSSRHGRRSRRRTGASSPDRQRVPPARVQHAPMRPLVSGDQRVQRLRSARARGLRRDRRRRGAVIRAHAPRSRPSPAPAPTPVPPRCRADPPARGIRCRTRRSRSVSAITAGLQAIGSRSTANPVRCRRRMYRTRPGPAGSSRSASSSVSPSRIRAVR